jgi:hypothetical protein
MQNTTEDADVVATTVRFPRAVRHRLEDAARSSFRTVSGEIAHRIKLSFELQSFHQIAPPQLPHKQSPATHAALPLSRAQSLRTGNGALLVGLLKLLLPTAKPAVAPTRRCVMRQ